MRWIVPLALVLAPVQALRAHDDGHGLSYIYYADGSGSSFGSGETGDWRVAQRYRGERGPLLYVRDNGAAYVIRDPALLRRLEAVMAPQRELGRRQGALGEQQGELGKRQARLGAEQARLGAQMASSTADRMRELGAQQGELGRRQAALGAQQSALGARQAEMGRDQARLARLAQPQIRALVAEAIRRGVAQRVQ